ncbi:OLC1v1024939C1 [Oldenlandia corymbosa var. corymbosa]|uniref:OLC1v1024939C1 n=1 Tax=Oldenlandia corymbosa var. corymbosa TaxID=529605 RepID=A0AAV1C4X8_OLDCO|nr:OLC1v1024939C1 [Oldenlandia corymbosa var. corymbosa]
MNEALLHRDVMTKETRRELNLLIEEQLQVHGSENPGTPLISVLLNEKNYLIWKNAMIPALEAKMKLGFVDGSFPKPPEGTLKCIRWNRANSLVCSWIKSSMMPDLAKYFMFVHDAKTLWSQLEKRYGTTSAPHLFELKREIALIKQGDTSISNYYGRIKQLWDQYEQLRPTPIVAGDVGILLRTREVEDHSMELLMGLNEVYEQEKNHILFLEPLPHEEEVYSRLLKAEMHRQVSLNMIAKDDNMAMMVKSSNWQKKPPVAVVDGQKTDKSTLLCSCCHRTGHIKDGCFKLIGYPTDKPVKKCNYCSREGHERKDCFKLNGYPDRQPKRQVQGHNAAAVSEDSPLEVELVVPSPHQLQAMMHMMQKEIDRMVKGKGRAGEGSTSHSVNSVHFPDFAGIPLCFSDLWSLLSSTMRFATSFSK